MIRSARITAASIAIVTYLVMGAVLYLSVLPGTGGLWPPDFHLKGYDAQSIAPFANALQAEARAAYATVLSGWDRIFAVAMAIWMTLVGWRGTWLRYAVAFLAVLYALIDLGENAAILRFLADDPLDADWVQVAKSLTMAKFAAFYLCLLVLIVHLRRNA